MPKGRKIGKNFFRVLKRFYPILEIFNRDYSEKNDTFVGHDASCPYGLGEGFFLLNNMLVLMRR